MGDLKLPLRIKVDVHDRFEASSTPPQKALSTLEGIIGLKAQCNIDWNLLYNALDAGFPDKTTFVPTIADVVVAWCDVLSTRLEDDKFSAWAEGIVDMLQASGKIKLRTQVLDVDRPMTAWSTEEGCFLLSFPRTSIFSPARVSSGFEADFVSLFTSEPSAISTESASLRPKDEEWAELDEAGEETRAKLATMSIGAVVGKELSPDRLPSPATLAPPDVLLQNMTPYILHVSQKGSGKLVEHGLSRSMNQGMGRSVGQNSSTQIEQGGNILVVQGTHGPSLLFLYQYLQRWVKKDPQDSRKCPLLRITLHDSFIGMGVQHDTLTIEPYDTYQEKRGIEMNPTVVIALIENVLGYQLLPNVSAGAWEFRRSAPFK